MAGKKDAAFYILQYLYKFTDDDHGVTNNDIISYLKRFDIVINERSIKPNIELINECFENTPFIEIHTYTEENKKHYRLINRPLELTEIEMLLSAIDTVKSFSKNDAKNIKAKLYSLLSAYQTDKLLPTISSRKDYINESGSVTWVLEVVNRAIVEEKKISVIYNSNGEYKQHSISPYRLHTSRDGIYILGKCDEHKSNISFFRVDRIRKILLTNDKGIMCKDMQELEDIIKYSKDMSFGEKGTAVFVFTKNIEKVMYDRYGSQANVVHLADGRMKISVEEYFSDTLLGFIFSMGRDIEVAGSATLVNMMKKKVAEWAGRL